MSEFVVDNSIEPEGPTLASDALLDVPVRIWAEIGRTRMPLAEAMALPEGFVIDLDREHNEPVDLFVNGLHFAVGRLVTVEGEWALAIDSLTEAGDELERLSSAP
jgi:flagellar motor switch protein FliN/FliY